jgi:DNA-binding transcriptional ArsR family regulator
MSGACAGPLTSRRAPATLSHMANHRGELDLVFSALGDPTRRAIVERLVHGPASVSQLAEPFDMALPSVLKHLAVLEQSGLVTSSKRGRIKLCEFQGDALTASSAWMQRHRAAWSTRLTALGTHLQKEENS